MEEFCCKNCGGELLPNQIEGTLKCKNCGSVFTHDEAEKERAFLQEALDEIKREKLLNLRKRLWEQINRKYTDSSAIVSVCREIKSVHAEDFLANFFEVANSGTAQEVNAFLDEIDVNENYGSIDAVLNFMIKSLKVENLLSVNNLVERAYKARNLEKYDELATKVSLEAKKVDNGVYELAIPRDVFIAYSSKDMAKVQQLVGVLEGQGLSCFVAMRNLQHGRGAAANYENALKTAMANCQTFVFVSSQNSRSFGCDALKHELKFIRDDDMSKTPFELRQTPYDRIPVKYKKPRVEWRLDDVRNNASVEKYVSEFFSGLEYCYTAQEVAERIGEFTLFGFAKDEEVPENAQIQALQAKIEEQNRLFREQMEKLQQQNKPVANGNLSDDDLIERMAQAQLLAEQRKKEKEEKLALIRSIAIGIRRLERKKVAEEKRRVEEARLAEERRIAEEKRKAEEARLAEARRIAEERRKAEEVQKKNLANCKIENGELLEYKGNDSVVIIPEGVIRIKELAFKNQFFTYFDSTTTPITKIILPSSLHHIDRDAFLSLKYLVEIEVGANNKYFKSIDGTLYSKNGKELIHYPAGKGEYTFEIPNGVTIIGYGAFYGCKWLGKIIIPDSVEDIYFNALCAPLSTIVLGENNTSFKLVDGNLYSKDGSSLIRYIPVKTEKRFVVPKEVSLIHGGAFYDSKCLNEVEFEGSSVYGIGSYAFGSCSELTYVKLPASVVDISKYAFSGCYKLILKWKNKVYLAKEAMVKKGLFNDKHLEFFCEADKEPATWEKGWKPGMFTKVHWGVKIEDFFKIIGKSHKNKQI